MDCTDFDADCGIISEGKLTVGQKLKKLFNISNQPRLIVSINGGLVENSFLSDGGKPIFQKDLEKVCSKEMFHYKFQYDLSI